MNGLAALDSPLRSLATTPLILYWRAINSWMVLFQHIIASACSSYVRKYIYLVVTKALKIFLVILAAVGIGCEL